MARPFDLIRAYPWLLLKGELLGRSGFPRLVDEHEAWAKSVLRAAGLPDTRDWLRLEDGRWVVAAPSDAPFGELLMGGQGFQRVSAVIADRRKDARLEVVRAEKAADRKAIEAARTAELNAELTYLAGVTLDYVERARTALRAGRADEAAFAFYKIAKHATVGLAIQHLEKNAIRGFKTRWSRLVSRPDIHKSTRESRIRWKAAAKEMKARNPKLSVRDVAARIAKREGAKAETVRKAISPARNG